MDTTISFIAAGLSRVHRRLLEDLRELEEEVSTSASDALPALRARLDTTLEHVIDHFRYEETNGYMDVIRESEPRLERTIQQLAEEHHQLTRALDDLIVEASAAASIDDGFRKKVCKWVDSVRRHETRENTLVQDAFGSDIGTED